MFKKCYTEDNSYFSYKEKLNNNQTVWVWFWECKDRHNKVYYSMGAEIYSKKKNIDKNLCNATITGKCGLSGLYLIKIVLELFIEFIENKKNSNITHLLIEWTDRKRENVYKKYLSKMGFKYKPDCGHLIYKFNYENK